MTRLREPAARPEAASVGPHRARRVGERVLVAGAGPGYALLTEAEYEAFRRGLPAGHPLRAELRGLGLLLDEPDVDAPARRLLESGRLNWPGPRTLAVRVSAGRRAMDLATVQACVDAAFSTPRPALTLELVDEEGAGWAGAWFCVEYAARRAEWGRRGLSLVYRTRREPEPRRLRSLAERGVVVRGEFSVDGPPGRPPFRAPRALARVGPKARGGAGWADALAQTGARGVEWRPSGAAALPGAGAEAFAAFAADALERMIETCETSDLRDETAVALLAARPWEIPGLDLFETLAFSLEGEVFASEEGLELAEEGDARLRLGRAEGFRFQDLPALALTQVLVAQTAADALPFCGACAYRAACLIPVSAHVRAAGALHGRVPESPRCRAHMAVLDRALTRLGSGNMLNFIEKWGIDRSLYPC